MYVLDDLIRPCRVELKSFASTGDATEQEETKPDGEYVLDNSLKCVYCEFVCKRVSHMDSHLRVVHKGFRKCSDCNIYFPRKVDLQKHLDEVHAETPDKCMYCGEVLHRKNAQLRKHVKECHSNVKIWHCSYGQCSKQFFTEHEQSNHFSRAHKKMSSVSHHCIFDNCEMSFKRTVTLTEHFKNKHNGIYFRCNFNKQCSLYFTNKNDMVVHIKNIHETISAFGIKRIKCLYCDEMVRDLQYHTEQHHKGKKQIKCRYVRCYVYFKSEQEQQEHEAQAHSLNRKGAKKCRLCQMTVLVKMRRHIVAYHKNELISFCKYKCGYYGSMDELDIHHAQPHKRDEMHQCIYCGLFFTKYSIPAHVKSKHRSQAIKCTHPCRTFFLTKADRNKHIVEKHSKAPINLRHFCIHCKKNLGSKGRLRDHVQNVHKQVCFMCSLQGCSEYFSSQSDLKNHFLEKHKEREDAKRFKCPKCNYTSVSKGHLQGHILIVHGRDKVSCPQCPKVYKSKLSMDRHLDAVHKQKRMTCNHCNHNVRKLKLHQRWTKCTNCQKVTLCITQTNQHMKVCSLSK